MSNRLERAVTTGFPPAGPAESREHLSVAPRARSRKFVAVGPLPPPISGGAAAFREVCEELERLGRLAAVIDIAPAVEGTGRIRSLRRAWTWVAALRTLRRELARREDAPGVYLLLGQARTSFARDVLCAALAAWYGAPLVGHIHGGSYDLLHEELSPPERRVLRAMLRRFERIIVLGDGLRSMLDFAPEVKDRLVSVPNGLPSESFAAPGPRTTAPSEPVQLLFLSNLVESKGYLEVLRAAALLKQRGTAVHVHLAGEFRTSPDDDVVTSPRHAATLVSELTASLGITSDVTLHGLVGEWDKQRLLERCDVLVLPTYFRYEGQPISIIEAMAAGLPVVSTRYRAIPDLVSDRETGVLVDDTRDTTLADAIAWVIRPEVYPRLSDGALERFASRFTARGFLDRMGSVLF